MSVDNKTEAHDNVWNTLSAVDVSEHIEKKGNLSYLSWAWAWGTLMEHYPEAEFSFRDWDGSPAFFLADGSASVECTITIPITIENNRTRSMSRTMWLPVMDNRNRSVTNPDSRAISDCRMRCLTKCIALLGLGHYIYAGEDVPTESKTTNKKKENGTGPVAGVVNVYKTFAQDQENMNDLRNWWKENLEELKKLETSEPETYREILGVFTERKKELQENA